MDSAIQEYKRTNQWRQLSIAAARIGDNNLARLANARALTEERGIVKIESISINWMDAYSNSPQLSIVLNREVVSDEYIYEHREGYYFARVGPVCNFYAYTAPGRGYGGAKINIVLSDGSEKLLVGPWSGNSGGTNRLFNQTKECAYIGRYNIAGAVDIDAIIPFLKEKGLGLIKCNMGRGVYYSITSKKKYPDSLYGQKPTSTSSYKFVEEVLESQ